MVKMSLSVASTYGNSETFYKCARDRRDRANRYAAGYSLANLRPGPKGAADATALQHRNLRLWDGYGWSAAAVDGDTALRLDAKATHPRSRVQLHTRVFCAVPGLARGQADPETEARVTAAVDTSATREAFPIGEVDFQRFDPGVRTVHVDNLVPHWTAGGDSSRDIARTRRFRKAVDRFAAATATGHLVASAGDDHSPETAAPAVSSSAIMGDACFAVGAGGDAWQRLLAASTNKSFLFGCGASAGPAPKAKH